MIDKTKSTIFEKQVQLSNRSIGSYEPVKDFLPGLQLNPARCNAKPFLKWAGGKTQLLEQFLSYYPTELKNDEITTYIEPFIGGGAVFFDVIRKFNIEKAFLYDINPELILAYYVIKHSPEDLINILSEFSQRYYLLDETKRSEFFYDVRKNYNSKLQSIDLKKYNKDCLLRTAQMIFLNKTCFNGLFRVNKKGGFNTPFGGYKNPKILDAENIINVSYALQIAEIKVGDFTDCENKVDSKTFVYFDPPYRPLTNTSSFTSYAKNTFDEKEQSRLAIFFEKLNEKNAKLMLSNSDPKNVNREDEFFDELYKKFNINRVAANRMINCNGNNRGKITELLITNY